MGLEEYRLKAREGEEKSIPRYGLASDSRYFDLGSLIEMYGVKEVENFLRGRGVVLGEEGLERVRR